MNKNVKRIIITLLLAVFFLITHQTGLLQPVENLTLTILGPVKNVSSSFLGGVSGAVSTITSIGNFKADNIKLNQENRTLKEELSRLKEVEVENEFLKQQLEFRNSSNQKTINSKVVGFNVDDLGYSFLVDSGFNDGVIQDTAVVSAEGFLLGTVTSVDSDISQVTIILDQSSVLSVRLQDSRSTGLIQGDHGLGINLSQIPVTDSLEQNEFVVTSGLSETIPDGLLIGEVEEVFSSGSGLFKSARVRPLADFRHIESVFIITRSN